MSPFLFRCKFMLVILLIYSYPSQICKNVPAFSVSKYLACMLVIKKHRTCRAVASYCKERMYIGVYALYLK